jgi:glycosyltransferase involved in cell wall biosynthesis
MISSVRASTYERWELIIVDDGSTEDLKGAIHGFNDSRIRYFRFDENRGIPKGTNFAIGEAGGKYICVIAADEVITTQKLAEQVNYLEANPHVDCVWGLPGSGSDGKQYPMGARPEWEQHAYARAQPLSGRMAENAHQPRERAHRRRIADDEGVRDEGARRVR